MYQSIWLPFINEHKVKTAAEAAVLSDEYALTHRPVIHDRDERRTTRYNGKDSGQAVFRQDSSYRNKADNERCHYCDESGHWKRYCPSVRNRLPTKSNFSGPSSANGVGCVANVRQSNPTPNVEQVNKDPTEGTASKGGSGCGVLDLPGEGQCFSESAIGHVGEGYGPFITDGFVSLVGSSEKRPVKILRDTGATETFVVESVLPFSGQSSTGNVVLIRGIGMQSMSVPLHNIELSSDLVKGNVVVGVCPALPVLGVHIILGNNLAGDRVWPSGPALPIVTIEPSRSVKQDECATVFPGVFTACAVTRANSRLRVMDSLSANKRACPQIPSLPSTLERDDFILAQKEDDGLTELRDGVLSGEELQRADQGYLSHDGLLNRKLVSLKD